MTKRTNSLEDRFPYEFKEVLSIVEQFKYFGEGTDIKKAIEDSVGSIVFRHQNFRERGTDKTITAAINDLRTAAMLSQNALGVLSDLDAKQRATLDIYLTFIIDYKEMKSLRPLLERFFGAAHDLEYLSYALAAATQVFVGTKRGRPTVPTTAATLELFKAWTALTGARMVTPDTKTGGGAQSTKEPSSYFVELCLSMIFGEIKPSVAQTSIRRVLAAKKRLPRLLAGTDPDAVFSNLIRKFSEDYSRIRSTKD